MKQERERGGGEDRRRKIHGDGHTIALNKIKRRG
jgi:hypothetical protein